MIYPIRSKEAIPHLLEAPVRRPAPHPAILHILPAIPHILLATALTSKENFQLFSIILLFVFYLIILLVLFLIFYYLFFYQILDDQVKTTIQIFYYFF